MTRSRGLFQNKGLFERRSQVLPVRLLQHRNAVFTRKHHVFALPWKLEWGSGADFLFLAAVTSDCELPLGRARAARPQPSTTGPEGEGPPAPAPRKRKRPPAGSRRGRSESGGTLFKSRCFARTILWPALVYLLYVPRGQTDSGGRWGCPVREALSSAQPQSSCQRNSPLMLQSRTLT